MSRLMWKELRENFKWALLAMVALGAAELYGIYPHNIQDESFGFQINGITLTKTSFLTVTTFGCAAVGLILGLIQILPELRRDRWAALLHRPVQRGVILWGKALAGLILYLIATAPPFLYCVWLAATPGHFDAPFDPGMVTPGTADIAMGAAYYFAALAVALQRGGGIVVRVLPFFAAIHASFFVLSNKLFYVALEAAMLMALALFLTAWGAIYNQDGLRARPWLGRVAFLAAVVYGICGAGDLLQSLWGAFHPSVYQPFERWEISREGIPLHITYGKGGVVIGVKDVNGNPFTDPKLKPDRVRNQIQGMNWCSEYIGDSHGWHLSTYQSSYRELRSYAWGNGPTYFPNPEQWFMLVGPRYMIGFLPQKKVPFAYLDRNGFEPANAAPHGFDPDVQVGIAADQGNYCLWTPNSVSFAYLGEQKLVPLVLPAPGPIYGVGYGWGTTKHGSVGVDAVTLGTGIAVYDKDAKLVTFLPHHRDVSRWGWISMGLNGTLDRFYLRYDPSGYLPEKVRKAMPSYLDVTDAQGNVLQTYTLVPLPDSPPTPRTWQKFLTQRFQGPIFYFGTMLYKEVGAVGGSVRLRGDLENQFRKHGAETADISAYVAVFSLLLAAAAYIWARRACIPSQRASAWAAFVFAFGLPGFLAFRLASDWPRLVSCPSCGRPRPIDRPACPHCHSGWPLPPATGVEIFEPAALTALALEERVQ
jgi:hypothetical protein